MAPIAIIPKACSCCKGERSSRDKSSNLPLPNILYEGSEGKVLKMDGPAAGGFLSLTGPLAPRVVETAVAAVYSRLTAEKPNNRASPVEMHPFCLRHLPRRGRFALCLTFISYVMNRISEISRLQRLFPLWCLRHHLPPAVRWDYTPPRSNHFISISRHSIASTSPSGGSTAAGGDRGAFPTPPGRLYGFIQTGGAAANHHPLNPLNPLNPGAERRLNPQAP